MFESAAFQQQEGPAAHEGPGDHVQEFQDQYQNAHQPPTVKENRTGLPNRDSRASSQLKNYHIETAASQTNPVRNCRREIFHFQGSTRRSAC